MTNDLNPSHNTKHSTFDVERSMFFFQINPTAKLVSQNVIPHKKYFGGSLPYAFTEHGIAMLSGILNSDRAISVNIGEVTCE